MDINNGMCLQWGWAYNIQVFPNIMTVTFPIVFSNTCACVIYFSNFGTSNISHIFNGFTSVGSITKSNFTISTNVLNMGSWLATGY